jgi:hypothetical protein
MGIGASVRAKYNLLDRSWSAFQSSVRLRRRFHETPQPFRPKGSVLSRLARFTITVGRPRGYSRIAESEEVSDQATGD